MTAQTAQLQKLIRKAELPPYTGLRRTAIAEMIKRGEFPAPIRINDKSVAWLESEVLAWQAERIALSRPEGTR